MHDRRLLPSLLKGEPSPESVRFLENRFSVSVLLVSTAVSLANVVGRIEIYSDTLVVALSNRSVWVTFSAGIAIFLAGLTHHPIGRGFQSIVVLLVAGVTALESTTGNLTSVVFFGLGLLVAAQYGLLRRWRVVKLILAMAIYGTFLVVGTYAQSRSTSLGAALNLVGAGFIAYLFVVIASIRLREMANRQEELARLVAERTSDLQEEVDRRKVAEEAATASAEKNRVLAADRAVLLRELHHRSKNDLQMILSLLSLRAEKGDHPELVEMFRPTQNRIRAIALVHEQLDNSARFDAIGISDYLEHLLTHLQISHREYQVVVEADIDADIAIKLESATHVGLLVHELVLCSYRYSFTENSPGTIWFTARTEGDQLILSIRDSGIGMPAELDPHSPDQDEIAIVSGLVRRLSCELNLDRSAAGGWSARIPLESVRHRSDKAEDAENDW